MSNFESCPRCIVGVFTPYGSEEKYLPGHPPFPALSRTDNETYICSDCGTEEAILDFTQNPLPQKDEWPVVTV